jgi:hypothetical protein
MKGNAHKTANGWMVSYLSGIKDLDSISVIPLNPQSSGDGLVDGQEIDFELQIGAKFDSSDTSTFRMAKLIPSYNKSEHTVSEIRFTIDECLDLFSKKIHTFRAYRDGEMIYEREYGYELLTESDYLTNYLSQTKI